MNYKKIECQEYNIHLIQNKGLHTLDISVQFMENVDKKMITYHNALVEIMTYATKKYDTNKKIVRECQDIYALRPVAYSARFGNLLNTRFNISVLNSKYIDDENLNNNIKLLKEIILNPLVSDDSFNEDNLKIIKKLLYSDIDSMKENPRTYTAYSMFTSLDKNENYSLTRYCDRKLLDEMTGKMLYQYYLKMIRESKIDIYIAGDIQDEEALVALIKQNFVFHKVKEKLSDALIYHHDIRKEREISEKSMYQQSKICIGYRIVNATRKELVYVLPLLDNIFGASSDSLLMKYVREKNSLCYYVNSYHNKLDSLLIVESAIRKSDYPLTLELIKNVFEMIKKGDFASSMLQRTKMEHLINLSMLEDSNRGLINYYFGMEVLKSESMEERKKIIKSITKNEIIKLAEKIHLDTIFFLEGEI